MLKEDLKLQPAFYAVIPADVRYSKKIVDGAKLLFGEVTALCSKHGYCFAGNEYFAELYDVEKRTIQRWLNGLTKEEHLYIIQEKGRRKIFISKKFSLNDIQDLPDETLDVGSEALKKFTNKPVILKSHSKKDKPIKKAVSKVTEDDTLLAELLLSKIIYNFPHFENKKVKISEWADDFRKLREIEKASVDQIRFMIMWVHGGDVQLPGGPLRHFEPNEFWAKNILSAGKLRKQWIDNLVPQVQTEFKKKTVTQL